ncbi:methylated-DNA--protein-cysteine methyltransferase [Pragia fontium]|uniref:Alkylated DNA nucleotide flippase Atl1, participates in nucleotide excision repair, Ada-like DNA-binding domain n=3 Tax=Pragia fontium TaxID=82985 RepID=A0AAJ5BGA0_9GAMM|nr:Alkylated DNA nucleotide flippase Atl1, participates in nucleotide excision repair, Ada-like DNA-binding domain [Pragia fontium DSM 5563 = ATCC 49100]SUB81922.1 methylated-DNA--protein-cysteine methyltransferase [Pragia fontium]VEJ54497.1 methylated-DNA--protein-cysteine methyltransferase [Pragia fontium]
MNRVIARLHPPSDVFLLNFAIYGKMGAPIQTFSHQIMNNTEQMDNHEPSLPTRIYTVVASIPAGKVTTYGTIARLAGAAGAARQVGIVLSRLPAGSKLPWFRVVNAQGKISLTGPDYIRQKQALLADGVLFTPSDRINFKIYGWLTPPS